MKRKTIIAAILTLALCVTSFVQEKASYEASAQGNIQVFIENKPLSLSIPPYMENGTTMVPVREIAEALGAIVLYTKETNGSRTVKLKRENREALLTLGSKVMMAGAKKVTLNTAPRSIGGVIMVPLRSLSEALGTIVTWDGLSRVVHINEPTELPVVGTPEKLMELLQQGSPGFNVALLGNDVTAVMENKEAETSVSPSAPGAESGDSGTSSEPTNDYSQTNTQVQGVDEADWAKTDGRFMYQISGSRVIIADISNPDQPRLAAELKYENDEGFQPQQLYIDRNQLIVIGQSAIMVEAQPEPSSELKMAIEPVGKRMIWPPHQTTSTVKTYLYELSESGKPELKRQLEQEGSYLSSRKIGDALYIVTNKYSYGFPVYNGLTTKEKSDGEVSKEQQELAQQLTRSFEPIYRDSAISKDALTISLEDIRYFPEPADNSMMLVGSVDLGQPNEQLQVSAYLGSGGTIYASKKNLYVAQSVYKSTGSGHEQETRIHKFRLDGGSVVYIGEGSVPGALLNQFSMDEHEGYFRIAVTKGNMWASGADGSTNNVYVLDEKLATIGTLEGLAPGERIYSVRFMGKRAYMVTFRNVDPLFALDLSQPAQPKVLGQLKIPGYSDYLHPYDDNHLIGFGKDTIELPSKGMGPDDTMAFYQGLKIALFDVSDVANPKEKFKEIIGDRGTHSELLQDHKALLFSKEKELLAFPVELHELKNKETLNAESFPPHGEFTFQGAYVYRLNLQGGFQLRGRVSHLTDEDMKKSGQYGFDYTKSVRRIMYAGDTLYTLSDAMLKANHMNSLSERGELTYPAFPDSNKNYPGEINVMPLPFGAE